VAKKHSVSAIRKQLVAQGIASAVLGENTSQLVAIAANIGAGLILKGFDRKAELEADQLGAVYAYRANYDPRELQKFLAALGKAAGDTPEWLQAVSDHPRSDDRVVRLNTLLAQPAFRTKTSLVVNRPQYQSAVIARFAAVPAPTPVPSAKPSGS
jgi:predicted Zn-dependent protease